MDWIHFQNNLLRSPLRRPFSFNIDVYCNWLEGLRTAIHTNMLDELQESSSKGKKARLIIKS